MPTSLDAQNFDHRVDPGDDFYRFTNGGWLDANPVPDDYGSWGAFREVQSQNEDLLRDLLARAAEAGLAAAADERMVGDYYASGMDLDAIETAGVEPIAEMLDGVEAVGSVDDLVSLISRFHRSGIGGLFRAGVAPDFDDSARYLVYIGQGGLGLPERDYYLRDDERSRVLLGQYEAHIAAMLELLGSDEPAEEAGAIVDFERRLASASLGAAELRDVDRTTNKFDTEELPNMLAGVDLGAYLSAVGASTARTVNVDNPDFFQSLGALLEETSPPVVRSYLRWNILRSTASSLPERFGDEAFSFYGQKLGGQKVQKERWKRVLAAASGDIGEQVARLFVAAAFSPEAKLRCEQMVEDILAAMGNSIRRLTWMSDDTKERALGKLSGFGYKIGYPERWRDYSSLVIDRGPYVLNRLRASAFEHRRRIRRLDEPVDRTEWEMPPHVVNAYYHPLHNEIIFPAGILQPPFFDAEADDAVNYGGIGAVIGHEITHGFDDQGSKFDAEGNLNNWWSGTDRTEFERRAAVLVEQFSRFAVDDDLHVNGELTLGENIADLGGLRIALAGLLSRTASDGEVDGFTPEQRFFLSYATIWRTNYTDEYLRFLVNSDSHSPAHYRVNGPVANLPEFAAAWGLDDTAEMVLPSSEVAEIW